MFRTAALRASSAGSSGGSSSRWYQPSHGFHPHQPSALHRYSAKILGASMWFFIFYRAKQDGAVMLGLKHPWDGHEHHDSHGEHGESHH
ncbi:unnamed protein product [Tilletia controversa]|uniref:NADH dehydrogenase [ubiquinone] 1 beta subcomplex subunit 2 n=3 Tax=Tilletia TaxID=13289 RepID=A0A8X7SY64_9BASI|nr:hypothetical protein CF336_g2590 [Tilletia laevis]KAE8204591.1 hypothetical protein CF328_g995 [Tilletia controversa]KAE8262940.1 hypothetical protein A4X03_0g2059 [Tilletia caries]KAE8205319.1 hypothetical protein CF335_g2348 [Tilletia laevis]KAE8251011.1 hypothetical protein A4X06_0g2855 [Tilletia controversa]